MPSNITGVVDCMPTLSRTSCASDYTGRRSVKAYANNAGVCFSQRLISSWCSLVIPSCLRRQSCKHALSPSARSRSIAIFPSRTGAEPLSGWFRDEIRRKGIAVVASVAVENVNLIYLVKIMLQGVGGELEVTPGSKTLPSRPVIPASYIFRDKPTARNSRKSRVKVARRATHIRPTLRSVVSYGT
jgi:hypothetical protein